MSIFDRARQAAEQAAHQARQASEQAAQRLHEPAATPAPGSAARADPSAPPAADTPLDDPAMTAASAPGPTGWLSPPPPGPMSAHDIADQARQLGGQARRGLSAAVDRIDPGLLADIVIKATGLQEKTNLALHAKGSAYRIGEVNVTVSLPPQISFSIVRVTDLPGDAPEVGYDPRERGGALPAVDIG